MGAFNMFRPSRVIGLAIAVALLTSAMALPAEADRMAESRGIAVGPVAKEAVREVLAEAGLGKQKLDDSDDRIARGLVRLVEAGIIENANVEELVELAKQGRLGQTISERARVTNNSRADAAKADRKPADRGRQGEENGSASNQGKPAAPGSQRDDNRSYYNRSNDDRPNDGSDS